MKFFIVDAFTDVAFGGNTAGVVLVDRGKDFPSEAVMQRVAAELRYSETAFVKCGNNEDFKIRYFTPMGEVDLCGHATIASFKVLLLLHRIEDNATYRLHTLAGELMIQLKNGAIYMDMATPKMIGEVCSGVELEELYRVMGLSYQGQLDKGLCYNPQLISTGLPDIMLPVCTIEDLERICPNYKMLSILSERYQVVGVHAFTLNCKDATCHVRNFAPRYGIDEESATGTSNGALTYYGYCNGFIHNDEDCRFIQGEVMHRPSIICSHIMVRDSSIKIQVGGQAIVVASGELNIE